MNFIQLTHRAFIVALSFEVMDSFYLLRPFTFALLYFAVNDHS